MFIDFSSAFNTIIPQKLMNISLCNWTQNFLTGRPQSVRMGKNTSRTITLSTGAPQGCVLSPLLFTVLTHDCMAPHGSDHNIKFADDMTVWGSSATMSWQSRGQTTGVKRTIYLSMLKKTK
ncbi:hypothetical protein LDENG_00003040 [Lucifuga dentata]|nr:hypothetical protein LDENG_00003040 [Lucifuga dentata]